MLCNVVTRPPSLQTALAIIAVLTYPNHLVVSSYYTEFAQQLSFLQISAALESAFWCYFLIPAVFVCLDVLFHAGDRVPSGQLSQQTACKPSSTEKSWI